MNKKISYIILGIVVISALVVIGVFLKKPAIAPVETPTAPAQTESETPAKPCETCEKGTAEAPTETSKLSSCVVLNEEYCEKGERIFFPGDLMLGVGFSLSEKIKIYSPFDGILNIVPVIIHPFTFEVIENKSAIEIIKWPIQKELQEFLLENVVVDSKLEKELREGSERIVDFRWEEENPPIKMIKVKKGELIGEISTGKYSSATSKEYFKEYNFWIMSRTSRTIPPYRPPEYIPDDYVNLDFIQQHFPYIK